MELRYQMTDILPLLPIPQPPNGKERLQYPEPIMRPCRFKGEASEYQSQTECVSVSQVRTIPGWCLRSLCLLHGHPAEKVLEGTLQRDCRETSAIPQGQRLPERNCSLRR